MSPIEIAYEKIDEARTQLGIIRIASAVGDREKVEEAIGKCDALSFEAFQLLETEIHLTIQPQGVVDLKP